MSVRMEYRDGKYWAVYEEDAYPVLTPHPEAVTPGLPIIPASDTGQRATAAQTPSVASVEPASAPAATPLPSTPMVDSGLPMTPMVDKGLPVTQMVDTGHHVTPMVDTGHPIAQMTPWHDLG